MGPPDTLATSQSGRHVTRRDILTANLVPVALAVFTPVSADDS
jgi:hypothetical protein